MFTGLIEETGTLRSSEPRAGGRRLVVKCRKVLEGIAVGDSLALSGVCQTVVAFGEDWAAFDAVGDTLKKTTLGFWRPGEVLNLERACRADTRMGGHFVLGHVQGVETALSAIEHGGAWHLEVSLAPERARYVAAEGSVALDGVSLTVAALTPRGFRVSVIPHTRSVTSLASFTVGRRVNLEVDILAKYVEALNRPRTGVQADQLAQWGYT